MKNHLKNPVVWSVVILLLAALVVVELNAYYISVLFTVFFYISIATGWNLSGGFMDYVDFGYAAWIGIGAYGTAVLLNAGFVWPISLIGGALISALIAFLLGLSILRLSGRYFSIATLGFFGMAHVLIASKYLKPWTNGGAGIYLETGFQIHHCLLLMAFISFIFIFVTYFLAKSHFGKEMLAIKSDEEAAEMVGVNTNRVKRSSYSLSAFVGGLAGGMLGIYLYFINPGAVFNTKYLLFPIIITIFGGGGSVMGPVLAAIAFGIIYEVLWVVFPGFFLTLIGAFLIGIMLLLPEEIIPWLKKNDKLPKVREW